MALLCSSLEWLRTQIKLRLEKAKTRNTRARLEVGFEAGEFDDLIDSDLDSDSEDGSSGRKTSTKKKGSGKNSSSSNVIQQMLLKGEAQHAASSSSKMQDEDEDEDLIKPTKGPSLAASSAKSLQQQQALEGAPPRIFFCSRTHTQIAQVIKELRRTRYRPIMSILASRRQLCINNSVNPGRVDKRKQKSKGKSHNINDACNEKVKSGKCPFFRKAEALAAAPQFNPGQSLEVFDIEDIVQLGAAVRGCPYFAARSKAEQAEIIFMPYNYVIDPRIRHSMGISLENAVIIIDEGHNAGSIGRDAASAELQEGLVAAAVKELTGLVKHNVNPSVYQPLKDVMVHVQDWINDQKENVFGDDWEKSSKPLDGREMVVWFERWGVTTTSLVDLDRNLAEAEKLAKAAMGPGSEEAKQQQAQIRAAFEAANIAGPSSDADAAISRGFVLSGGVLQVLRNLLSVCAFVLAQPQLKNEEHYNMVLVGEPAWVKKLGAARKTKEWHYKLCMWCFSPSVAFRSLATESHSLILTSGTLSPLDSFACELGVEFAHKLEAPHVIASSQVLPCVIASGPSPSGGCSRESFKCTYANVNRLEFLDSLGQVFLQTAMRVPDGVLAFFTSYKTIDNAVRRWKDTGLWDELLKWKLVVEETRGTGVEFDQGRTAFELANDRSFTLRQGGEDLYLSDSFFEPAAELGDGNISWRDTRPSPEDVLDSSERKMSSQYRQLLRPSQTGALYLAVCRGKLSEGIDFADRSARAVLIVGIPYPSYKALQVQLKRSHNDRHVQLQRRANPRAPTTQLSGDQWYTQSAFRAVNQAVGRTIRHRNDYGAIIFVDQRWSYENNILHLSKWLRKIMLDGSRLQSTRAESTVSQVGAFFAQMASMFPESAGNPGALNAIKQLPLDSNAAAAAAASGAGSDGSVAIRVTESMPELQNVSDDGDSVNENVGMSTFRSASTMLARSPVPQITEPGSVAGEDCSPSAVLTQVPLSNFSSDQMIVGNQLGDESAMHQMKCAHCQRTLISVGAGLIQESTMDSMIGTSLVHAELCARAGRAHDDEMEVQPTRPVLMLDEDRIAEGGGHSMVPMFSVQQIQHAITCNGQPGQSQDEMTTSQSIAASVSAEMCAVPWFESEDEEMFYMPMACMGCFKLVGARERMFGPGMDGAHRLWVSTELVSVTQMLSPSAPAAGSLDSAIPGCAPVNRASSSQLALTPRRSLRHSGVRPPPAPIFLPSSFEEPSISAATSSSALRMRAISSDSNGLSSNAAAAAAAAAATRVLNGAGESPEAAALDTSSFAAMDTSTFVEAVPRRAAQERRAAARRAAAAARRESEPASRPRKKQRKPKKSSKNRSRSRSTRSSWE